MGPAHPLRGHIFISVTMETTRGANLLGQEDGEAVALWRLHEHVRLEHIS